MPESGTPGARSEDHLFDLVELPQQGPVHLAVALPGGELRALPGFPAAALPESGRVASGRGLAAAACRRSCLGEAVELASCCAWGDETLVRAREEELGAAAVPPEALNGFSTAQLAERDAWNEERGSFDWRPAVRGRRQAIDWLQAEDAYDGRPGYLPADFVLIGRREPGDETAVAIADSNGCAAGADFDAAKLAAVLELIERDATARWWYRRRPCPPVALEALEVGQELTRWLGERRRRTWLFEIASKVALPVLAAASAEPDGRDVALGFAARGERDAAAIAAVTEMAQMEHSLAMARLLGEGAGTWNEWRRRVSLALPPLEAALCAPADAASAGVRAPSAQGLSAVLERCAAAGVDLWFVDLTRPVFGARAVRAASAALTHYKPRFGKLPDGGAAAAQVPLLI